MTTSIADLIARLRRAVDTGYVLRSTETRALLDALTAQEVENARLREALDKIASPATVGGMHEQDRAGKLQDIAARVLTHREQE